MLADARSQLGIRVGGSHSTLGQPPLWECEVPRADVEGARLPRGESEEFEEGEEAWKVKDSGCAL